jgi:4-diphosphocytidyl-2-C-methyl-D-erythritol kinase
LPSFAKINWLLRILGKREDGYHELFTVFQTISLYDTIRFELSNELEFSCDDHTIPVKDNLVVQAAGELNRVLGTSYGARIHLEKRIPSPGGLGGGSSNAAVALIGLARLWQLPADAGLMTEIAAGLGADVPFFLHGGTASGTGRGDIVDERPDILAPEMLIITPDIPVSTADAFGSVAADPLTPEGRKRILIVSRNGADRIDPLTSELKNDLEPTVFAAHPEIRRVKETLLALGARNAAMSGSGASVFAVFDNKETRQAAIKALEIESTWRKIAVATISRDKYRESLVI